MKNFDEFRPEEIEGQIEQLARATAEESSGARVVQALQSFYARDASLLEQVWRRLENHQTGQQAAQTWPSEEKRRENITSMRSPSIDAPREHTLDGSQQNQKKWPGVGLFGKLAAVLVCVLLVSSLIWALSASRGNTHGASTGKSSAPTGEASDAPGIYILDVLNRNTSKYAVIKLDVHTHVVLWSYPVPLDGSLGNPIFVNGDTVYVALALGNNAYLYALNTLNGSLRWKVAMNQYTIPGQSGSKAAQAGSIMQPTAAQGMVYILASGGSLVALDATTGKHLWTYTSSTAASDCTNAEIMDGLVYGTCHNVIFALNARTGAFSWSQSAPSNQIFNSPVAVDGTIYLTSSQADQHYIGEPVSGGVYAYNGTNGHLLWQHPIDNWVGDAPTVVDGVVYFGSNDQSIYGLRASDGVQVWRYDAGGVVGGVEVSNGVAYAEQEGIQQGDALSGTPSFMAVQISNSQRLWVKKGTWGIDAALGDVLYIHGADGFTVLAGRTGAVIWHGTEAVLGIDIVP